MGWLKRIFSLCRQDRLQRDLEDEIQSHVEMRTRANIAAGRLPYDARREALLQFGNVTVQAERARDAEVNCWLDARWQDLRYAVRVLRKSPGSTAVAVLSIAIGIGANTAIFGLINALLFKTLPVKDPRQLVTVGYSEPHGPQPATVFSGFSYEDYREMRDHSGQYLELYATAFGVPVMRLGDRVERLRVEAVSGNYYTVLGASPYLGRYIQPDDDSEAGARLVAVLSYRFWRSRFGGDPRAVGKPILLDGVPFAVIGVEPRTFGDSPLSAGVDAFVPLTAMPRIQRNDYTIFAFPAGRLRTGVSIQQAEAALTGIFAGRTKQATLIRLESNARGVYHGRERFLKPLQVSMAAVSLVLLIACANVANLLLARGAARQQEISVRLTIGAGRARIVSQLLTEIALISGLGGTIGIALAYAGESAVVAMLRSGTGALPVDIHPDAMVLLFTVGVSVLTGLLFGVFPAFQAARADLNPGLKEGASHLAGGRRQLLVRRSLLVAQVALSLVLLTGAGWFARTLTNLRTLDTGYDRRGILLAAIDVTQAGYSDERTYRFLEEILDRARALPGVESAGEASTAVLTGAAYDFPIFIVAGNIVAGNTVDGNIADRTRKCDTSMTVASPGYIETMRIPLLAGRTLQAQDSAPLAPGAVVINQALARACFGAANPIGRRVRRIDQKDPRTFSEIVGIVGNAKYREIRERDRPMFYTPPRSYGAFGLTLHVRTSIDPRSLVSPLRHELRSMDPNIPLAGVLTLEEQSERSLLQDRLLAAISEAFGTIALLLAVIGMYGVLAFMVTRRGTEFGVRMALGASRMKVVWLVLKESLLLVLLGGAIGAWGALVAHRAIQGLLFGVGTSDERELVVAAAALLVTAALASFIPATRAARIDPMTSLRRE